MRDDSVLLRPVVIDAEDISKIWHMMSSEACSKLDVRSVARVLSHFIARGHLALAVFPESHQWHALHSSDASLLEELVVLQLVHFNSFSVGARFSKQSHLWVADLAKKCCCVVVGARRSYFQLAAQNSQFSSFLAERFLRPSFQGEDVVIGQNYNGNDPLALRSDEVSSLDEDLVNFQLAAEHQMFLLTRLADILQCEKLSRESLRISHELNATPIRMIENRLLSTISHRKKNLLTNGYENRLAYDDEDPPLPEYVPRRRHRVHSFEPTATATIGNENSIYRVGRCSSDDVDPIQVQVSSLTAAFVETLAEMFGREKAMDLVRRWPTCTDISQLVEAGLSEHPEDAQETPILEDPQELLIEIE